MDRSGSSRVCWRGSIWTLCASRWSDTTRRAGVRKICLGVVLYSSRALNRCFAAL